MPILTLQTKISGLTRLPWGQEMELGAVLALALGLEPQERLLDPCVFLSPEAKRLGFVLRVGMADATIQHLAELALSCF